MNEPNERRVLIIAPVGQDGEAMAGVLNAQGIPSEVCAEPEECSKQIATGAGALLLTEEVLEMRGADELLADLRSQPAWSELPVIVLTSGGESRLMHLLELAASAAGTVIFLERPLSPATLLRSVEAALRTRRRQYQVRDLMAEQERQRREIRQSRDRLELLSRAVSTLLRTADPQDVIERLCNDVREFLDCAVFFNFLLDPETRRLRLNACGGVDARLARYVEGLELVDSLCGTAAREGRRVLEENLGASDDPRTTPVRSLGIRAYACHPLLGPENEALGTLAFGAGSRDVFSAEDLDLMKTVTDHVAVAMIRRRSEEALRDSERQFRALADSIPNLAWFARGDGFITWYNERWYTYTGTTPEQMEGWGWQLVHDPELLPSVLERWKAAIANGQPFEMEFPLRGANGKFRWFLTRAIPVRDDDGKVLRWFGTNTDVSEIRDARMVLSRDKAELERLVAERTTKLRELVGELEHFSYSITHDMRAPLRAMMGYAAVVEEMSADSPNQEQKEFLRRIGISARRMDLLITDALTYSKAVRSELPLAPVDVGQLLRGMVDTYPELQGARRGIRLERDLPPVIGNEAGLTQCFSNLLGNAVKFVKPGESPQIRVRAEVLDSGGPEDGEGEWVRLWVEDNGIGISESMLPRVFDMFARGANHQAGTGIGLALVRKVVSRMGGRVGVQSEEGKGSRFWVDLKPGDVRQYGIKSVERGM